jgi:hypothetical protein
VVAPARLHATFFGILTALILAVPASALAATPTGDMYDPVDARKQQASSGLAFTGLDIWLVVLAGIVILVTGLAIRRATRTD